MHCRFRTTFAAGLFAATLATGCSQSPQDQYDDAVNSLNDSKQELNDAQKRVENARQQMRQAQQSFQQAQQDLDSTRQDMEQARQKVQKSATDQILFRVLQKDVLNKSRFSDAAISVGVEQSVVTLTGAVPDKKTRDKAVELVKNQPGVAHVVDRLQISKSGDSAPDSAGQNNKGTNQNQ
ncbi:BON domain-containing protein [Salinisphaera sp. Q1T1-3]|uniref:BON domain-containing protein n=1 Tax=Salinisphaera sp. Q1T1-3 TaxID=2321229 RepID=UPI0013140057|nr:BON domain-containing protein [Salinisphaera sp. Q1T1-3]